MTAIVLSELASAQQRLLEEMRAAVAALPDEATFEEFRVEAISLREEMRTGQVRIRNLVLAEGLSFLILAATFAVTFGR